MTAFTGILARPPPRAGRAGIGRLAGIIGAQESLEQEGYVLKCC